MKKTILFLATALFLLEGGASKVWAQSTNFTGYLRNYTGILLKDDNDFAIMQDTFDLRIEHSRGKVGFKANPYIYFNHNGETEIDIRQSYMDIYLDTVDIRFGKQQIVWGKADGVSITDVISPKDMREFLLPDFEEIRLGIQALKIDYYLGDNTLELVWVPVFTPTTMPDADSIWYRQPDFPITPTFDYSKKDVTSDLKSGEIFVKFSAITSGIDFEIMAGSMWDDDPTLHVQKTFNSTTGQLSSITVTPEHHMLKLGGGSFSTTVGGSVIRGETAYYEGKYFKSDDPAVTDGVMEKNVMHYLLGLDFTILDVKMSLQLIEQQIQDYDEQILDDENVDTVTFLINKDFLRETLRLEMFSYFDLNNDGSLVRPKISYDLIDGFNIIVGLNIFNGTEGKFGQYDDNDMVYSKVKYSF